MSPVGGVKHFIESSSGQFVFFVFRSHNSFPIIPNWVSCFGNTVGDLHSQQSRPTLQLIGQTQYMIYNKGEDENDKTVYHLFSLGGQHSYRPLTVFVDPGNLCHALKY